MGECNHGGGQWWTMQLCKLCGQDPKQVEIERLRAALAAATERAEANATEVHLLGERVRIECERRDQARRERDAAIVRADALAARLAEVDGEHPA